MKYYEKKLSGFTIIFLHDFSNCVNCQMVEQRKFVGGSIGNSTPRKTFIRRINRTPPPILNLSPFDSEDDEYDSSEPEFEFRKSLAVPLKKLKVLRKKKDRDENYNAFRSLPVDQPKKKNSYEPVKKNSLKLTKKAKVETVTKPSVKKELTVKKRAGEVKKTPGKGTLKRKRWYMEKLNTSNDNYEDDIFENQEFSQFQNLFEGEETDSSEQYEELKTPVFPFSISPRAESPSPTYRDCYSPTELSISRKTSEEYHYRKGKRKKALDDKKGPLSKRPKPLKKEPNVTKTLEAVVKILNHHGNILDKSSSDDDEDGYYEVSNSSPTTSLVA